VKFNAAGLAFYLGFSFDRFIVIASPPTNLNNLFSPRAPETMT
jgi:hypothetical protein